jgi:hypothetical protein
MIQSVFLSRGRLVLASQSVERAGSWAPDGRALARSYYALCLLVTAHNLTRRGRRDRVVHARCAILRRRFEIV